MRLKKLERNVLFTCINIFIYLPILTHICKLAAELFAGQLAAAVFE